MPHDFTVGDFELPDIAELAAGRDWWIKQQKPGTVAWRAKNNIDGILSSDAHQHYDLASQALLRYVHGRTIDAGHFVVYEYPDMTNLELAWTHGLSVDYLTRHYLFLAEYLLTVRNNCHPRESEQPQTGASSKPAATAAGIVCVVDMKTDSFMRLSSTFFNARNTYLTIFKTLNDNYPAVELLLIINAPYLFNRIWSIISTVLDKEITDRTNILGGQDEFLPVLKGILRPEDIPRCYGGEDDTPFGEKDDHVAMVAYAHRLAEHNGGKLASNDDCEPPMDEVSSREVLLDSSEINPGDDRGAYASLSSAAVQVGNSVHQFDSDQGDHSSEEEEFFDPEAGVTFVNAKRDTTRCCRCRRLFGKKSSLMESRSGGDMNGCSCASWMTSARRACGDALIRALCCFGAVLCYLASFPPKQVAKAVLILGTSCTIAYWCVEDMSAWIPAPWRCLFRKGPC